MSFEGFPTETITFLRGVRDNNTKAWFDANRADYEDYFLAPARAFVTAAGRSLRKVSPAIRAEPKVNGSIFRINRDIRFAKDKRPYKDHLDLWFWEGERKAAVSGYFFRLTPDSLGIGAGAHGFDAEQLRAYRDGVVDAVAGKSLKRAVTAVEKSGWAVRGQRYQRVPAGYEPVGDAAGRLIRHNALWVGEDEPIPAALHRPELVDYAVERWRQAAPIHRWLVKYLD